MFKILLPLILFFNLTLFNQDYNLDIVPYEYETYVPSQNQLKKISKLDYNKLEIKRTRLKSGKYIKYHYLNGKLYNGWVFQIFENDKHKYRYLKIENGLITWQIGYFDNGQLDHDFHQKHGYDCGRQRMWRRNGDKYIDNFKLEGEISHGDQYRWSANNILAEHSKYENGKLIFKIIYDESGNILKTEGNPPKK